MKGQEQKYDMRAPPRRRVKGEEPDDQPVFLRKAFAMITSCPAEIGGWSEKGDTVIIKDVKQFSEKIIPTAYKHNNFSSFVRQLNFYGFRKVKSESMDHAEWWEFRHPQFLRDEPNLISEIKRSVHFEAGNGQEVAELKHQVTGLTDRITALHEQIDKLTGLVNHMQVKEEPVSPTPTSDQKKRKLTVKNVASLGPRMVESVPLQRMSSLDSNMMIGEYEAAGEDLPSGPDLLSSGIDFFGNMIVPGRTYDSALLLDDDMDMDVLFTSDSDGDIATPENSATASPSLSAAAPMQNVSKQSYYEPMSSLPQASAVPMYVPQYQQNQIPTAPAVAAIGAVSAAASDISSVLDSLSPELRLRFVDRLAEVMGAQLTQNISQQVSVQVQVQNQQQQASPVPAAHSYSGMPKASQCYSAASSSSAYGANAPNASAVNDAAHFLLPSGSRAPEIAIPLASAAIAALLSSMHSFSQNNLQQQPQVPPVAIKEEVSCK